MATSTNTVALAAHLTFPPWWVLALYLANTIFQLPYSRFARVCSFAIGLYHWQNVVLLLVCMDKLITKPAWQFGPHVVATLGLFTLPKCDQFSCIYDT